MNPVSLQLFHKASLEIRKRANGHQYTRALGDMLALRSPYKLTSTKSEAASLLWLPKNTSG